MRGGAGRSLTTVEGAGADAERVGDLVPVFYSHGLPGEVVGGREHLDVRGASAGNPQKGRKGEKSNAHNRQSFGDRNA
jgi:hypothetical protein